jgi:hypothetical protein
MRFLTGTLLIIVALAQAGCADQSSAAGVPHLALPAEITETVRETFASEPRLWIFPDGTWSVRASDDGAGVLTQSATDRVYPLALSKAKRYGDLDLTVRFRPLSGKVDASGGLVFRARDERNYYLVRANALEDNFRIYTVINGSRSQIASVRVDPPALGQWHTLRVVAIGAHIQADLDGRLVIDHNDQTYTAGYIGLWTKADSVTEFASFQVIGAAIAGP